MFDQPVVFLDIETNGGYGERGRIIEIGAIRVEGDEVVDTFHSMVNPGTNLPHWITRLTGITENDVVGAPYFEDIAEQLHTFLQSAIFIAHNVRFDFSFIKRQLEASGFVYRPKLLCTVRLSRALYPDVKGHSLEKIIARHNIPVNARHRALDDAKAIYEFTRLAYRQNDQTSFKTAIAQQLKTKTLPPNVPEDTFANLPKKPGVYIFKGEDHAPLYIGKSIDIHARVRSHFVNDTKIAKELKISQRTWSVDHIVTDNELDALLLESAMVKEHRPLFNQKLRRVRLQSVIVGAINDEGYQALSIEQRPLTDPSEIDDVYGVFKSKTTAKGALESQCRAWQLCPKLLGLEKTKGSCFYYQLGKCKGACIGKEPNEMYNLRVEQAMKATKLDSWPFASPILLTINAVKGYVIHNWVITHTADYDESLDNNFTPVQPDFDIDRYSILKQFIHKHSQNVTIKRLKNLPSF
jgi:DNA polymerase III subunit epsilon